MNEIIHGDAVEVLGELPDDSVHTVVTSPPYFQQRDYGEDGEIGDEDSIDEYVDNLVFVSERLSNVVRDGGSFMLNIGDVYRSKEKQLVPDEVARYISQTTDWWLRQTLVWVKEGTKPDPATDRRSVDYEYIYHFVQSEDYYYDESVADGSHDSVIVTSTANSQTDHTAVFPETLVEELLEGVHPTRVCGRCGMPYERCYDCIPRPFTETDRPQSQRAYELYEDSALTDEHIEAIQSVGISDVGKAVETEDGAGRNTVEKELLASEAKDVLGGYYREFTMTERRPTGFEPSCDCDGTATGGVVCDPFVGSGTTCAVAERDNQRYVGIDLSKESCDIAVRRLETTNTVVERGVGGIV